MAVERDFKGIWIPASLWLDPKLTPFLKVLLGEIDSLDCGLGCYKSDANLAERMQCSEGHVKNSIVMLKKEGYLVTLSRSHRKRHLRTKYSEHLQSKIDLTSKVRETLRSSSSTMMSRTKRDSEPAASQVRVTVSPAGKMAKRFLEFAIEKRLLTGRAAPNPFTWRKAIEKLMTQLDCDPSRIAKVMKWHFVHFRDDYCPVAYAATTFCDKFLAIERVAGMTPHVEDAPPKDNRIITKGKVSDIDWNF